MAIMDIIKRETSPPRTPRKTMASLFSLYKISSSLSSYSAPQSPISVSSASHTISQSTMEENIEKSESMIKKWDPDSSSYEKYNSLFQENKREAKEFIMCVNGLRQVMHFLISEHSSSEKLVLAHKLMQTAMKRLEKEFYQILSTNKEHLDPESVSSRSSYLSNSHSSSSDDEDNINEVHDAGESISEVERLSMIAMADLKLIAECMISSGYGKECVHIYKIIRKSTVDEGLYRLGIEQYNSYQINKMNAGSLEQHIKNWMKGVKIAVKTLFHGEKFLCDHVFSISETTRESCFSDISREGAINLFKFPELVQRVYKSPETIFVLMDLYDSISDLWPEIESIFGHESSLAIKSQALSSLNKLRGSVQTILSEFESSIKKKSSKRPVPGGGIHPVTNAVMDFLSSLANYSGVLTDIIGHSSSAWQSPLPEAYFESANMGGSPTSAVSVRLAWIILVLLCKLDRKAEQYNEVALSYLFLANNLLFVVQRVDTSSLKYLLGEDWISKHERKVKQYAANYEATAWTKVKSCLPVNPTTEMSQEIVKGCFKQFNSTFDEVYKKHKSWVVSDGKLREEIKVSIARKLVPDYQQFYDSCLVTLSQENLEMLVRYSPDNLGNCLSDLLRGTTVSGSSFSSL